MRHIAGFVFVLAVLSLAATAWATRWQVLHVEQDGHMLYLMNRWTDEIRVISRSEWKHVEQYQPRASDRIEGPAPNR